MYRTFNMGIGMCAVLPERQAERAIAIARRHGVRAQIIGSVAEEKGIFIAGMRL